MDKNNPHKGASVGMVIAIVVVLAIIGFGLYLIYTPQSVPPLDTDSAPLGDGPATEIGGAAFVDEIDVELMESFPLQAQAVIRGSLSDACTSVDEARAAQSGMTFTVIISTVRPKDAVCAQVLTAFEERVSLDIQGLSKGTYSVVAGDAEATFTLEQDNVLDENTSPEDTEETAL